MKTDAHFIVESFMKGDHVDERFMNREADKFARTIDYIKLIRL